MTPSGATEVAARQPAPTRGWPVWGRPLGLLALILAGPLLLLPTPLSPVAQTWMVLLVLAIWSIGVVAFIGALVGTSTPILQGLERLLRAWVARFAPDPETLWIQWAREAHRPSQGQWCLEQGARLGGSEALFQEGLAYFDGGFGAGGDIVGAERMERAARMGHPEAAFWLAESLRTGRGGPRDSRGALDWYQRSAAAGFGPAASWLAHAFAAGEGVAADPDLARRWAGVAGRLPQPALSRSPLRHDAAREDPLIETGAQVARHLEDVAERLISHRAGRWALTGGGVLMAGLGLGVVVTFFLVGASGFFFLPVLMMLPPGLMLAWQGWRLRQEGPRQGRDRLQEAADTGDPEACFRLGLACQKGSYHRPRDDQEAARWFRQAAEAGHRGAMEALSQAYLGGHGVIRDPREAARWAEASRRNA